MTALAPIRPDLLRIGVRAGGGLVVRRGADDGVRVLLVHRPKRDDWSFPKGGRRRGETLLATALREVREETGHLCLAHDVVGVTEYLDRLGCSKLVRYWAMLPVTGAFTPNEEVDMVAWVRPKEAVVRLTHERDVDLLNGAVTTLEGVLDAQDARMIQSLG